MPSKKIIFNFSVFLPLGLAALSATASAADLINRELVRAGQECLDRGDQDCAIHQFSKALLADPDNKEAQQGLEKLGLKKGIYGRGKTDLGAVTEMSQEIQDYQQRMTAMEQERLDKEQRAAALEQEKQSLRQALSDKESEVQTAHQRASQMADGYEIQIKDIKSQAAVDSRLAKKLSRELTALKAKLDKKLELIDRKNARIRDLEAQLKASRKDHAVTQKTSRQDLVRQGDRMADMEKEYLDYKTKASDSDARDREEIEALRRQLQAERTSLGKTAVEFKTAKSQLARAETMAVEKDRTIEDLKYSLANLRQELADAQGVIDQGCPDSGELDAVESCDKVAWVKSQDEMIARLKSDLVQAKGDLVRLQNEDGRDTALQIESLKQQLAGTEGQMKAAEESLAEEKASAVLLEKRLSDAKQQMELLNKVLKEKDSRIRELEDLIGEPSPARK
ncbi:MAG: hypothetical protein U1D99_09425 [Candidatus Omnitrophota bacterium]|nr:hypothetical protein [Candidatus Omnitrophota bacterium]